MNIKDIFIHNRNQNQQLNNNNDDNKIFDAPMVEESTIELPRQDSFDCLNRFFKLLEIHSKSTNLAEMDNILQHHKNYHLF